MFFNCDDFESLHEMIDKIDQTIQEGQNSLSQEDQLIYSKLQNTNKILEINNTDQFIPTQILSTFYKTPIIQQQQRDNTNILKNKDQIEIIESNDCNSSDTQSLSIINDQQQQLIFVEQQQWQLILNQFGNFFKAFTYNIIKINQHINSLLSQDNLFQDQDNNNKVYLAFFIETKERIVVKEQELQDQSLIDTAQQFVIHDYIYQLYPTMFLRLLLPVYIDIDQKPNKLKFISFTEQGLVDLYQYSQQKLIKNLEFQLIFQQIFQQILLLHKYNIAHRDIKPQNVIYVEHKGWVLCDFENSFKYTQLNGVYEIKGTYGFLLPQLQAKSKIRGIQLKQNLLQNDLYALAITLIVIKYQITSQDFIKQYLDYPKDPIVEVLLKSVSLSDLQNYIFNSEMRFIRPQLKQIQQAQSAVCFNDEQIVEFIYVLGRLNKINQISSESKQQILSKIDEKLKKNKINNNNYIDILCYTVIPQYVDQLKNIVKYKELRQRKYWNNIINKLAVINNTQQISNQIKFMQSIGLTDLCLFYAQQYIQIKYDYSIHIFMIDLLDSFSNYEEAQNQFNILLTQREFYQMNQLEQNIFMQYAFKNISKHNEVPYMDMDILYQFQENKQNFVYNDISLLRHYSDEEFVEQFTLNIQKIIEVDTYMWHWKLSNLCEIIFDISIVKNLQMSIKLLDIVKQNIKLKCITPLWQDFIKMQIQMNELARLDNKKFIKEMNYIALLNSESTFQQQLLTFQKYFIQFFCNSKKKYFKNKIIHKILVSIRNLQSSNKFYMFHTMRELIQILQEASEQKILYKMFFILVCVSKQQNLLEQLKRLGRLTATDYFML